MSLILYLIFSHLIFISSRPFLKNFFQNKFQTKSEESLLMIIIQYILILILTYLFIFLIAFLFIGIDSFYIRPTYFFEYINDF